MSTLNRSYLFLIIVAAIWGVAPPVIKHVLEFLPADVFLAYRFIITIIIMTPFLLKTEPKTWHVLSTLSAKDWLLLLIVGLLGSTFQLGFLFWGLSQTSAIDASLINATSPVLTALGSYFILKEHISGHQITGLVTAFLGTCLIVFAPILIGNHDGSSGSFFGNFLVFLGTLSWTTYVLITKKFLNHKISPLLLTTSMFYIGTIVMSAIVILSNPSQGPAVVTNLISIPASAQFGILYLAVFSGGLAYWLYQKAQHHIKASQANIFLYLSPVFTLPISHFLLRESITLPIVIGSLIIGIGVTIAEVSRKRLQHIS